MKYYLIVGEASGDLHASNLMAAIRQEDPEADFRFFGGDLMTAVGGKRVKHYRELAYMGFIPVLLHLPAIFANMRLCKEDIVQWHPDVVILVDYPGFNLGIAKFVRAKTRIPVFYYISPKIWAWKTYRIKNIKRDVDELFPFFLLKWIFIGSMTIPFTMWAIRVWMLWLNSGKPLRRHGQSFCMPTDLTLRVPLSPCWQAAASRKSRTTCPT